MNFIEIKLLFFVTIQNGHSRQRGNNYNIKSKIDRALKKVSL